MTVNAKVYLLSPAEEYVIEFYTGAKTLLYTIARALSAATSIYSVPPALPVEPALSMQQVTLIIRKVFIAYASNQNLLMPRHPAQKEHEKNAHHLATSAEFFLLAHEIGHVWIAYEPVASAQSCLRGDKPTKEEELACDSLAISWLLSDAIKRGCGVRMAYAGAEFALRVLAFLDHVGTPFEATHPVPDDRLVNLQYVARSLCNTLGASFDEVRTIAVAHDEFLEAVEQSMGDVDTSPNQDRTKLRSKLIVLLEEWSKGMVDEEFAQAEMHLFKKYASAEAMAGAVLDVREHCNTNQPDRVGLLDRLVAGLPHPVPNS